MKKLTKKQDDTLMIELSIRGRASDVNTILKNASEKEAGGLWGRILVVLPVVLRRYWRQE